MYKIKNNFLSACMCCLFLGIMIIECADILDVLFIVIGVSVLAINSYEFNRELKKIFKNKVKKTIDRE